MTVKYLKILTYLIVWLGASNYLLAQNEFPTAKNSSVKIDGGSINLLRPNVVGGWARGVSFFNVDASTKFMTLGAFGNNDSMTRFFIGSGESPWSNGSGLYILPDGNIGIGAVTPTHKLQVSGSGKWTGNASSYTEINSNATGQYIRQYANNGSTQSWIIRGYALNGVQAEFGEGGINVNGTVKAKEVNITATGWADHVFDPQYDLMDLGTLKGFVEQNRHLPGIPTEKEVKEEGIDLATINAKLLEKIEELTLYIIQQEEKAKELESGLRELKQLIQEKP